MWNYLILALILWPEDPPVPSQAPPEAWKALKEVSVKLEVVGPHESWGSNFYLELRYVRNYWRDLRDMPRLADSLVLPPSCVAGDLCAFNKQYQCHLERQQVICLYRSDLLGDVLSETRELHEVWACVRMATCETESWPNRRRSLHRLRELLGEEAYYSGWLPVPVPYWRFQLID